jgi:hypothetical protein
MKYQHIKYICLFLIGIVVTSCYDRDVIDHKEFNHSMPAVENLECTDNGSSVHLSWTIPASIPEDIVRPIEVRIQVVENDIYKQIVTVSEAVNQADINTEPGKSYHFIVKLVGNIKDEDRMLGESSRVYSEGVIVKK